MRGWLGAARARIASGRFLFVALALAGCQSVGGVRSSPGTDVGPPAVIVRPGRISRAERSQAARLWYAAQRSFESRRYLETLRSTADLLNRFPASDVSGEALRLSARAEFEVGAMERSDEAAGRYLDLLLPGDRRGAEMRLLQAEAVSGDAALRLDRLLRIDSGASDAEIRIASAFVREAVNSLALEEVERIAVGVESAGPLMPVVDAMLAVNLLEAGRREPAEVYAQRAIDGGARGSELAVAEGVLRGEFPEGRGRATTFQIGVVLPIGGSPALAGFAASVVEGIEVAVATVLGEGFTVTLLVRDDEGDPVLSAQWVEELELEGVAGVVGFLQDDVLVAAGQAREIGVPLVSPTARSADRAGEGVYSLEGPDPAAAASIARYAASRAFQRVAIIYPRTPDAAAEADAFEAEARALGIPVVGRFTYEAGATFFERQILAARDLLRKAEITALGLTADETLHVELLEPVALFLPIPPEDVKFVAPQVVHFGLDTLAIEILGTSGWTDPQTLIDVPPRLTTGVVATAPAGTGAGSDGQLRFQQAYEEYFHRSLVGKTAAVGYDATLLLLEALRPGRLRPEDVRLSFDGLVDIRGATGLFSVLEGRIVRKTEVVRIDERRPVPIRGR
ncbi:MAG: ABC transporter substrate-binding protein [Gemmatimonadetes bacterium]|nr:ABC transporter substrate-binding protein [Gemmatimonadota bacterium]